MTQPSFILGVDLGTSSCKAALIDDTGTVVCTANESYPTASPGPAWSEQNPADWQDAIVKAVPRVLEESDKTSEDIAGVALASAAHIGVLLDAQGAPVRPAILWNDQRTVAEVADLEREAGEEILTASCQAVSTGWTLPHLLWVKRHDPDAWRRTRSILLSKDFIVKWLTGRAVTDPATAVSAQLYDVQASRWSPRLCELAGVEPEMLPEVVPATDQAGELTADAAADLGLLPGTPVITGTLDSATELLAAGICVPGDGLVRLATAGGVQCVVEAPSPDRYRITYPHAVIPYWYCQAGTNTCAAAVQWAVGCLTSDPEPSYETWDGAAAQVPAGADGVLFHPYLAGERAPHWDPQLRGSFTGLSLRHGRGHLARAVYEGTAFSIRQATTVLPDLPDCNSPLAVVGGGARSALWLDILANVLGRPLRVAEDADSSTGAALLGLAGLGLAGDLRTLAEARATTGRVVNPDDRQCAFYSDWFEAYADLHRRLAPFYSELAPLS